MDNTDALKKTVSDFVDFGNELWCCEMDGVATDGLFNVKKLNNSFVDLLIEVLNVNNIESLELERAIEIYFRNDAQLNTGLDRYFLEVNDENIDNALKVVDIMHDCNSSSTILFFVDCLNKAQIKTAPVFLSRLVNNVLSDLYVDDKPIPEMPVLNSLVASVLSTTKIDSFGASTFCKCLSLLETSAFKAKCDEIEDFYEPITVEVDLLHNVIGIYLFGPEYQGLELTRRSLFENGENTSDFWENTWRLNKETCVSVTLPELT